MSSPEGETVIVVHCMAYSLPPWQPNSVYEVTFSEFSPFSVIAENHIKLVHKASHSMIFMGMM